MKNLKLLFATLFAFVCIGIAHAQSPSYVTADFKALNTQGCSPFVVLLFDSSRSDNTITARRWVITNASGDTVFQDNANKTTIGLNLTEAGCYTVSLLSVNRFQVSDYKVKQDYICVKPRPKIDFTLSTMGGCPPLTVNYQCNSQALCGTIDSVTIDFKNGTVETFPACGTYAATYTNSGNYTPTFYVKNSCGCYADSTWTAPIVVSPKPTASFTATGSTQSCTAPYAVSFSAQTQGPRAKYQWFVDGVSQQNSTSLAFNYNFGYGAHDVKLVVTDTVIGCSDTLSRLDYVVVGQPAQPAFTASKTSGCTPLNVVLRNQTVGNATNLKWVITDDQNNVVVQRSGSPALFDSIGYSFSTVGTYNVCLIATFNGGCMDTFCAPNFISVGTLPSSDFTVDKTAHCTVPATSVATLVTPCVGCTYKWSTTGLPIANTASLNATYTTSGNKNISVTVTDANGCSSTTTKNSIVKISNLKAILFKTGKGGCPPYTVSFADSTKAPEPITGVSWSFPGANITSATGKTPPAVTYNTTGEYVVTMQVQTASGCVATVRDTIRVSNKPAGPFTVSPTTVCYEEIPNVFKWTGSAFDTLFWSFGDGGKATTLVDSISYFYQDLGNFSPCVIASKDGCRSDSICLNQVTINGPAANFKDSSHCTNRKQFYYLNDSKQATSYVWSFCDGTTSTQFNMQKLYAGCDTCSVKLTAYNSQTGCTHSKTLLTSVICPDADFTVSDTVGCINFRPVFTNTSSSKTQTRWDFNTNNGRQYVNAAHSPTTPSNTYTTPGYFGVSMINTDAKGCRDTITKPNLIKITKVTANMSASDTVFCIPNTVTFTNTSTAAMSSVTQSVWSYGDGSDVDSSNNGSHEYTVQGVYRPVLTVYNEYGCRDTASKQILANKIVAVATFDDSTCVGTTNLFSNQSTGINQVYQWHFPGGIPSYSIGRNVNVVYNVEGDYPVMLVVHDNTGTCRDTLRDTIHVYNPIANYGLSQKYAQCPNPPFLVQFYDSSRNDIESWEWDFGDGTPISNLRNPSHYYHHAGEFPVRLTVRTNNGCEATVVKDTVKVEGPYATMTFAPLPGICPCDSVEFTINTVSAVQAILLDGQNSPYTFPPIVPSGTFDNPVVLKRKVQFCTSGTANAQVLVSDGAGCNVLLQPIPVLIDTPSTHFSFVNNVCDSGSVCFTDNTMFFTPGTAFASRLWNFGDGNTDTVANPCHVFSAPGDYMVTLTVYNNLGCSMSETQKVHIHASPKVMVAANDSTGCVPQTIQFSNVSLIDSTTGIASLSWDFGNGNTSTVANPLQAYTAAGLYNVKLTVVDSFGCTGVGGLDITINALPTAQGTGDTTICVGGAAQLSGLGGVNCVWSPAVGLNNPASCNPVASPDNDQQYVLTAIDANGCQGTDTVLVRVAKINASFTANSVCFPAATQFTYNGSNTNGNIASYFYDLGDGNNAATANHAHSYTAANSYSVRLIVADNHGCQDDTIHSVIVRATPVAQAIADTVCFGQVTTLTDVSNLGGANVASRVWNVANQVKSDSIVTVTFPTAGLFTATLKVINDAGCSDSTSINIFVRSNPVADFTATQACEGKATDFTATAQNGTGVINNLLWDFNTVVAGADTAAGTNNAQYTYAAAGTYQAALHVTDNFGCAHDTVKQVTVFVLPQALFSVANNCTNATINFASNSIAGSNSIAAHNWIFGTGTPATSTAANPAIQVGNTPGNYAVQLVVTDTKGCADTLNSAFRIFEGPQAKMFVYDSTVCLNNCVQLTSLSTPGEGSITTYAWEMNANGTVDYTTDKVACHKYATPGNKTVKLTVADTNGCVDTATANIQILSIPTADFQWQAVCQATPMALINQSVQGSGALQSCLWIFHDGSFNNSCNTNKVFTVGGDYPVSFVAVDVFGCSDTVSKMVHVDVPTQLDVNAGDTTICKGELVAYNVQGVFSQIEWKPATYVSNPTEANVVINPSSSIKYIVEAKNGACKPVFDTLKVDVIQQVPLAVSAAPDKVLLGVNTNITAEIGGKIDSIIWSPSEGLDCYNCSNPKATPQATTTYYATIYYSMNGVTCTQTDSVSITVFESCGESPIFVPNTFTPNGDGLNDGFTIRGAGISRIKNFRIFDRWGKMVFATENAPINSAAASWFGTDMGGKELNPGVFVYMYEIVCMNNEVLTGKGNITLIK
ncbi:MAG: PKD domain-containing protein [Chitinophagales bacterium]